MPSNSPPKPASPSLSDQARRRAFLQQLFLSAGGLAATSIGWPRLAQAKAGAKAAAPLWPIGPLQAPDANGICLPAGYSSRVVAVSGETPAAGSPYIWHDSPDGGATFATPDGGWVYTNNSELNAGQGGVGALRFDARGQLLQAYPILTGTTFNCAGGPTPWGTWLSAEEHAGGQVWECDPLGSPADAKVRPTLGIFKHEALAIDPVHKIVYLTEDERDGRFYRWLGSAADWPSGAKRPALREGRLQVLQVVPPTPAPAQPFPWLADAALDPSKPHRVRWVDVQQPTQPQAALRARLGRDAPGTVFKGGEGLWYFGGIVYFSTKGDDRIWAYEHASSRLQTIYDFASASPANRVLSGVDNLTVSQAGDVMVAEDGGNMELCVIRPDWKVSRKEGQQVSVLLRVMGQDASEITGPAFSPDGRRLYFNSQRGGRNGMGRGITYEVQLPGR